MGDPVVLFLDDEPQILNALRRILRREPYEVLTAVTPEEAFTLIDNHSVTLMISDQKMPEMSGTEFLAQVKEIDPTIRSILLTGYTEDPDVITARESDKTLTVLSKPWDDDNLKQLIRNKLEE